ncbi:hypothetical protein ABH923_003102 [Leifsonia sp. EB41]|uniref:hypothetical protein n=1 Tax=Leifsonia sp. EB41 TaxID=3156260 RepID=UPI003518E806
MITTISISTGMSGVPDFGNSPWSKARWVSSGGTTDSAAPISTSTIVMMMAALCAANSDTIRRNRCGMRGASAFSARWAAASPVLTRERMGPPPPTMPRIPLTPKAYVGVVGADSGPVTPSEEHRAPARG